MFVYAKLFLISNSSMSLFVLFYFLSAASKLCGIICIFQVLTVASSVPLKVSEALSAAEEARYSLEDLLQREQIISNLLTQVQTTQIHRLENILYRHN